MFSFTADSVVGSDDFTDLQSVSVAGGVVTIKAQAFIYKEYRDITFTWTPGAEVATIEIAYYDCQRNCKNDVRVRTL